MMNGVEESNESTVWLNQAFVEKILKRGKNDAELSVTHIDIENAVLKGENFASIIMRVTVEYKNRSGITEETKKCSLIVKSLPKGEFVERWITAMDAFVRELRIYEVTLPQIYKLVLEKTGSDQEHLATNCYATDRPDTIILEDLRPLGYKMADRREGLDLEHSVLAIRTLAKLHASSMVLHAEDPETMDFYKEACYIEENRNLHIDCLENIFNNLATEVGTWTGFERFAEKIKTIASCAVDRTIEMAKNKNGSLRVLNHGDFWTNNMLFLYENGKPIDLKMLDFQLVRFASPALDILSFLYSSPKQEVLEDYWDRMIEEYLESLNATLRCLGDDRVVSLADINRELENKAFFAVITSCLFCIMVAEPEDAPDFTEIKEEDFEKGKGMDGMNKALSGKRFRTTFERRLPKFEEQGLL